MEPGGDIPPPYSEHDPHTPLSTLTPATTAHSVPLTSPSQISLRGGYLRGVPYHEDPSVVSYFQERPFDFQPDRPLITVERDITPETVREDLQYPSNIDASRDVTEQDWQTFVNYVLTELSNETPSTKKHKKKLNRDDFQACQDRIETVVAEWNEGFFGPRSIFFVPNFYYDRPLNAGRSGNTDRAQTGATTTYHDAATVHATPLPQPAETKRDNRGWGQGPSHHAGGPFGQRGRPFAPFKGPLGALNGPIGMLSGQLGHQLGYHHGHHGHHGGPFGWGGGPFRRGGFGGRFGHHHGHHHGFDGYSYGSSRRRSRSRSSSSSSSDSDSDHDGRRRSHGWHGRRSGSRHGHGERRGRGRHRGDKHHGRRGRSSSSSSSSSMSSNPSISSFSSSDFDGADMNQLRSSFAKFQIDPTNKSQNKAAIRQLRNDLKAQRKEARANKNTLKRELKGGSRAQKREFKSEFRTLKRELKRQGREANRQHRAWKREQKRERRNVKRAGKKVLNEPAIDQSNQSKELDGQTRGVVGKDPRATHPPESILSSATQLSTYSEAGRKDADSDMTRREMRRMAKDLDREACSLEKGAKDLERQAKQRREEFDREKSERLAEAQRQGREFQEEAETQSRDLKKKGERTADLGRLATLQADEIHSEAEAVNAREEEKCNTDIATLYSQAREAREQAEMLTAQARGIRDSIEEQDSGHGNGYGPRGFDNREGFHPWAAPGGDAGAGPSMGMRGQGYGPGIGGQAEAFGRDIGRWGERFGRYMERWGEDFGKKMEAHGRTIEKKFS